MLLTIKLVNLKGEEQTKEVEDVVSYYVNENILKIACNQPKSNQEILLRSNDGIGMDDWVILEIKASRVALKPEGVTLG